MQLSVVIPTLNEAGNIAELIGRVRRVIEELGIGAEIVIVDGGSADATCEEAASAGASVVFNAARRYGDALRAGLRAARGTYVLTMDADFSHTPEFLAQMWMFRRDADVIIASRYIPGGRSQTSPLRAALSRLLNLVFISLLRIPVHDISSGYRLYRREVLVGMPLAARDFDILEEILIRLHTRGHVIREVPLHYRPRRAGKSNVRLARFAVAYLKTLWKMVWLRWGPAPKRAA